MTEATRTATTSLRQCLACLPDNQHVEKAIELIQTFKVSFKL